jgi:hypothetical protein
VVEVSRVEICGMPFDVNRRVQRDADEVSGVDDRRDVERDAGLERLQLRRRYRSGGAAGRREHGQIIARTDRRGAPRNRRNARVRQHARLAARNEQIQLQPERQRRAGERLKAEQRGRRSARERGRRRHFPVGRADVRVGRTSRRQAEPEVLLGRLVDFVDLRIQHDKLLRHVELLDQIFREGDVLLRAVEH